MHANFGSRLDHLSDEMCQMNTRIDCNGHHQSPFGGFMPPLLSCPKLKMVQRMKDRAFKMYFSDFFFFFSFSKINKYIDLSTI